MKFCSLLIPLFLFLQSNAETAPYRVQGKLAGSLKAKYAYLNIMMVKPDIKGSFLKATIKDNKFVFEGSLQTSKIESRSGRIFVSDNPNLTVKDIGTFMKQTDDDTRIILLEPDVNVEIKESVRYANVSGTKNMLVYNEHQLISIFERTRFNEISRKYHELQKAARGDNEKILKLKSDQAQEYLTHQKNMFLKRFAIVKKYPESEQNIGCLVLLSAMSKSNNLERMLLDSLESAWTVASPYIKHHPRSKQIPVNLKAAKEKPVVLAPGTEIPDHIFNYERGKISTTDLRGNYVFLDFWASWCAPCRAQHHDLKEAWAKFNTKNFTILQISLDDKKEAWLKALKQDGLPWQNLRNETGWDSEMKQIFDVQQLPTNYLIDPEGKIIAKNISGKELKALLKKLIH